MTSNNDKASQADGICLECSYLAGKVYKMCLRCFEIYQERERATGIAFEQWLEKYSESYGEALEGDTPGMLRAAFFAGRESSPSGVASIAQDRDGVLESARITATNATVDRAINAIKELATLNFATVLDALAKLKLGDEHPLASLFGKYADDPMWEDFLKAIEEGRAIEDEDEDSALALKRQPKEEGR